MIEIKFVFPVKHDAYKMNIDMNHFFQGSQVFIDNNVIVTPVKKTRTNDGKHIWHFYLYISKDDQDVTVEKSREINGGMLNIVNKNRNVWAFV